MNLRESITNFVGSAQQRTAQALRRGADALAQTKIIQGVGRQGYGGPALPKDVDASKKVASTEALFGRVSSRLGPIPENISTHPLRNITPERVGAIHEEVLVAGWMLNKACLDEDLILADSHLRSVDNSYRVAIVGSPFTVEPCDGSDLARAVADYQQYVLHQCDGWQRMCKRLLFGDLAGYAIEEAVYQDRLFNFRSGGKSYTVDAPCPAAFEWVRNTNSRFNLGLGQILELDTGAGQFVNPYESPHKWLIYEAADDFQLRRRGYAYTAIWLSMIKLNAWMRWGVLLDIWGLRAPIGKAARDLFQDATRLAQMRRAIEDWGRGLGLIVTDDFEVEASAGISDGDARGMHAALIGIINSELSKLRQGEQLTTETGGAGSYALSETHADTKAEHIEAGEQNLSTNLLPWSRAWLRLASQEYRDGIWGAPRPRGLSAALGVKPEDVVAKAGLPQWRVTREMTPQVRMELYKSAVNDLSMDIDPDGPYREFGFAKARKDGEKIKGKPIALSGQRGAVISTTDIEGITQAPQTEEGSKDVNSEQ